MSPKKEEKEKDDRLCEWTQILARLPTEDLLEFKLVCKSWCNLIESFVFNDLHSTFNFSSSSSRFGSFILGSFCMVDSSENSLIMLSSKSESESGYDLKVKRLGFPCYKSSCTFDPVVGSCNGIVCLYDRISNRVCLSNPATNKSRFLPRPIEFGMGWVNYLAAFGFDVETKDYKVVLLSGDPLKSYRPVAPIECLCRGQVYSLSTDSWSLCEGITCLPGDPFRYPTNVLYLNGSCFFLAMFFHTKQQPCFPESNRFIISFDFTKEIITVIQLPDHHRDQELYLSSLGDKIALFINIKKGYQNGTCCYDDYNIWVLREHDGSSCSSVNKESWTKLCSFRIKHETPGERNEPRGISNDGQFVLLQTRDDTRSPNKMKLYDLATKGVKLNFLYGHWAVMSKAVAYKPNLVSIMRGKKRSSSRRRRTLIG